MGFIGTVKKVVENQALLKHYDTKKNVNTAIIEKLLLWSETVLRLAQQWRITVDLPGSSLYHLRVH